MMLAYLLQKNKSMRIRIIVLTLLSYFTLNSQTNQNNIDFIDKIYDFSLSKGNSYEWIDYLSNKIGFRISG